MELEEYIQKVDAAGPCRRLDPEQQAGGGHPGHLAGGPEALAVLNSQLVRGVKLLNEELEATRRLRRELEDELARARKPWRVQVRRRA